MTILSAIAYNNLCWYGALLGESGRALNSCEGAVELEPNEPRYCDRHGLWRALNGDFLGAFEDFEFYVQTAAQD